MESNRVYNLLNSKRCICTVEKIFCVCIALLPFLWVYNVPFVNVSVGTVILFAFFPYLLAKIYPRYHNNISGLPLLLLVFYVYFSIRSEGNVKKIMLYLLAFFQLWGIEKGTLPERKFRNILEYFASINAILILCQTLLFYLFKIKVPFVAYGLLQRDYMQTYAGVEFAGRLYRPCGLFLEPAFYSQYALFALISCLFPLRGNVKVRQSILICMGIVCSTSGMGIVLMAFVCAWYLLGSGGDIYQKIRRVGIACALGLAAVLVLSILPFFRETLMRVFARVDGYNAFEGRTQHWGTALSSLNVLELIFGLGGEHEFVFYLSGMPTTIYQYGLVGVALQLSIFFWVMFKKKDNYTWCSAVVFLTLFCVAKLTGVFSQLFYFSIIFVHLYTDREEDMETKKKWKEINKDNMQEVTDEEIKRISIEILTDVARFCDQNALRYYLVCGTALGAIRHNGFIPWDDDIDIGMPRPDYEKFIANYQSESCYLIDSRSGKDYPYAFAKVCDKRTTLIEKIENPFPMGVYIDVFPIDGIPSEPEKQKKHLRKIDWDLRLISWKRISKEKKLDWIHKIIQIIAKSVLSMIPFSVLIEKLNRDLQGIPYESSEYVGHLATKAYWGEDRKPKHVFAPPVKHSFEDQEFWVPGDYDAYLKLEYGEYMKLPPVEKQVSHHDYVAYWKN